MKILLKNEVSGLGKRKDVVDVADGYARNFLIPKGLALKATASNLKIIDEERKRETKRKEKEKEACKLLAKKIEEISSTITARAGEDEKLYGSVTAQEVAEALAKEGIDIDKKKILLNEPIKTLGIYHVDIKIHPEVKATAKVWVIKE